jgi:hypothetical protein
MPALRALAALAAAVAGIAIAANPAVAQSVDDAMALGGTLAGEIPAGQSTSIGVLVPQGSTATQIQVKGVQVKGAPVFTPVVSLVRPDGTVLDQEDLAAAGATVKASTKAVTIKNFPATETGLYKVVVAGLDGAAGSFTAKVKGKPAKTLKPPLSTISPANEKESHVIHVGENSFLTATVKPGKTTPFGPSLEIISPSGQILNADAYTKTGKDDSVTVKNYPLPHFGKFTLRVGSRGGTGDYTLSAKIAAKKPVAVPGAPTAEGGADQVVAPGAAGGFSGTGSSGATFSWEQVSGPTVTLTNRTTATPTFTAPATKGTYAFQLYTRTATATSVPSLVVLDVDRIPFADAGAGQHVAASATVTLDGSDSFDLEPADVLTYEWTQVSGPTATLSDSRAASPTFTAATGTYVFRLRVRDGIAWSDPVDTIVVAGGGSGFADAGRPVISVRQDTIFLSGVRSRAASGASPATFLWTQISGTSVDLEGADTATPSFVAPKADGTFRFRLVADGSSATADEVVVVLASGLAANATPVAISGGVRTVTAESEFTLDGSQSQDDGSIAHYEWMQSYGPDGALATGDGGQRTATSAASGVQQFVLMVHDGRKYGAPDVCTAVAGDTVPVASAGTDRSGGAGTNITLDSTASTVPAGRTLTTRTWRQVTGTAVWDVDAQDAGFNPAAASPVIAVPTNLSSLTGKRTFVFGLVVADDLANESVEDTVVVTFTGLPVNATPTVDATSPVSIVRPGTNVTLGASASDPDGDSVTYAWTQISGPTASLAGASSATPSFNAPGASGTLVYRCTVNDGTGSANATAFDEVSVSVNQPPVLGGNMTPLAGPPTTAVTVAGTATDPEGDSLSYAWSQVSGPTADSVTGATTLNLGFNCPTYTGSITQRRIVYRLTVTDSFGPTTQDFTFQPNRAPSLNAIIATGDRKFLFKDSAASSTDKSETLSGSPATDADGDTISFSWTVVSGPITTGILSAATGASTIVSVAKPSASQQETGGVFTIGCTGSDSIESSTQVTIQVLAYPSWTSDVYPILQGSCSGASCHSGIQSPNLTNGSSTVRTTILNNGPPYIVPNNHTGSDLWNRVNTGNMPKAPNPSLSQHQINMLKYWIKPEHNGTAGTLSTGAENN